jgi:hypothetical protein
MGRIAFPTSMPVFTTAIQDSMMDKDHPPSGGKFSFASRATSRSTHGPATHDRRRLPFADYLLALPAVIILAVIAIAGYLRLHGTWEETRDFILIFLLVTCLLMGVAFATCLHS